MFFSVFIRKLCKYSTTDFTIENSKTRIESLKAFISYKGLTYTLNKNRLNYLNFVFFGVRIEEEFGMRTNETPTHYIYPPHKRIYLRPHTISLIYGLPRETKIEHDLFKGQYKSTLKII